MPEQEQTQPPDLAQLWRDWLTQSERQFTAFLNETMGTETFARSVGGHMELYAAFQRILAEGMERYLALLNMPSRADITGLGETLRAIEARLGRIEETLQLAAAAVDGQDGATAPASEPRRTRRPEGLPEQVSIGVEGIPDEYRR